jgi:hypothetical protein
MTTEKAITVCGLDENGALHELGVVEVPLPPLLTAGAAINRLLKSVPRRAYAVASGMGVVAQLLRPVQRVARATPDIAELICLKGRHPALCFSRRVWEQAGGFDESAPDAQVLETFAARVVSLRACIAVELD